MYTSNLPIDSATTRREFQCSISLNFVISVFSCINWGWEYLKMLAGRITENSGVEKNSKKDRRCQTSAILWTPIFNKFLIPMIAGTIKLRRELHESRNSGYFSVFLLRCRCFRDFRARTSLLFGLFERIK
eukprot:Lithocolla_globosa_v1_NODE_195_length_5267_cov_27.182464.p5 type:complete len:130 gc:universal NODE_195_length_5267_cov_27.182464:4174-4563(+)